MKLLTTNYLDDATLTTSTENPQYTVDNVQDPHLSTKFRFTSKTSQYIVVDLASATECDSVAILGHNLTATATLKIQANSSDSWASPPVDETITASVDEIAHFFTAATYRYWRFTFTDTSNTNSYIELGRLFLSKSTTVSKSFTNKFQENNVNTSKQYYSTSGQIYGVKGITYRVYQLDFRLWTTSMINTIKQIKEDTSGITPIVAVLDESDMTSLKPLYCIIENDINGTHVWNYNYSTQMTLREVK
jgi:hypothetical protein